MTVLILTLFLYYIFSVCASFQRSRLRLGGALPAGSVSFVAPLAGEAFLVCGCKGTATFPTHQIFQQLFSKYFSRGHVGYIIYYMCAGEKAFDCVRPRRAADSPAAVWSYMRHSVFLCTSCTGVTLRSTPACSPAPLVGLINFLNCLNCRYPKS